MSEFSFEDKYDLISTEISKRRGRWQLRAIPSMDFDDVTQIVLIHISKKWYQWNQSLPLEPWLNKVITRRITNILRDVYTNCVRPCLGCAKNEGGDLCASTPSGRQCGECPFYKEWEMKKKSAYDTRLPVSIENHQQEIFSLPEESIDVEHLAADLHKRIQPLLSPIELRVYDSLFVKFQSEEEAAKLMGYRTSERNRKAGYRRIKQIRRKIMEKVKKVTKDYF